MTRYVIGNWKSALSTEDSIALVRALVQVEVPPTTTTIVCPSLAALPLVGPELQGQPIVLGAQDVSEFEPGAHTGDVAAEHLQALGCRYVIIGHSERRLGLGETALVIQQKLHRAYAAGLIPILCIGETADERDRGRTMEYLRVQLEESLATIVLAGRSLIVAYEPVWAIGSGTTVEPADAAQVAMMIEKVVHEFAKGELQEFAVVYGGSVTPANAASFVTATPLSGVLVGGASLKADLFAGIIQACAV